MTGGLHSNGMGIRTTRGQGARAAIAGAIAAAILTGLPAANAANVGWNGSSAADTNFIVTGTNSWMYGIGSPTVTSVGTTDNPFVLNNGANIVFIGKDGKLVLDSTTDQGSGRSNTLQGIRVGQSGAVNYSTVSGGANLQGNGTLTVNGATSLRIDTAGDFIMGGANNRTGVVTWNSTGTLQVDGAFRVANNANTGVGIFTQNAGTVIVGRDAVATNIFAAIANDGTGTYNLNEGVFEVGAALDSATSQEVRRNLRVGADTGNGTFNLGDGTGAAGSATFRTWDDVVVGHSGTTTVGNLTIKSDGRFEQHFATLTKTAGGGGADAPFIITSGAVNHMGGVVDTDGILQFGKDATTAAAYNILSSAGSLNVRALDIGAKGTLAFTFDATGTMKMTVEGSDNVAGDTAIGITLNAAAVLTLNSFSSYASDNTVTLIESLDANVFPTGTFAGFAQGQAVGMNSLGTQFYINYAGGAGNNDVVLQSTPLTTEPTGDFDNDGDVDGIDFLAWQAHFGKETEAVRGEGDSEPNGKVDGADYTVWESEFGTSPVLAAAGVVPEPTTSGLACAAMLGLALRRARARR